MLAAEPEGEPVDVPTADVRPPAEDAGGGGSGALLPSSAKETRLRVSDSERPSSGGPWSPAPAASARPAAAAAAACSCCHQKAPWPLAPVLLLLA